MRRVRRDPLGAALVRAIGACRAGDAPVEELSLRSWASATFVGAVYRFAVDVPDEAGAAALAAALQDHEFALKGHIVADIASTGQPLECGGVRLVVEVLTIEE